MLDKTLDNARYIRLVWIYQIGILVINKDTGYGYHSF